MKAKELIVNISMSVSWCRLKGEVAKINISELRNSINNDTAQINKYNEKIEDILK
jgi:hypothetical protein